MNDRDTIQWTTSYQIGDVDMFPEVPALAARLGVEPDTGTGKTFIQMSDGRRYDLFAMLNAFLDRIDAATLGDK